LGPHLGYQIPPELLALIGLPPSLANLILTALLVVLVLHPIAAGFSFLAFISSLYLASHPVAIFGLVTSIIASLLATIVLAVDISIAVVVRDKLNEFLSGGFTVVWGNAIWMVLAATVCSWGGVIILSARVCYCCGIRRCVRTILARVTRWSHVWMQYRSFISFGLGFQEGHLLTNSRVTDHYVLTTYTIKPRQCCLSQLRWTIGYRMITAWGGYMQSTKWLRVPRIGRGQRVTMCPSQSSVSPMKRQRAPTHARSPASALPTAAEGLAAAPRW
jgi:hypothetical protein